MPHCIHRPSRSCSCRSPERARHGRPAEARPGRPVEAHQTGQSPTCPCCAATAGRRRIVGGSDRQADRQLLQTSIVFPTYKQIKINRQTDTHRHTDRETNQALIVSGDFLPQGIGDASFILHKDESKPTLYGGSGNGAARQWFSCVVLHACNRHGFSPYALQPIAPKPLQLHFQALIQCVSKFSSCSYRKENSCRINLGNEA